MSTEQNKEVVILWLEERNKGNWDIISELFAPDYVCHLASDPEPVRGRDKVKMMNVGSRWGFDIYPTHEPDLLIAEADLVVHRETVRYKAKDPFRGFPPTEKEAIVSIVDIYRIVDGRIVEQWNHLDRFGMMYQFGNIPTPG
ncbi:MAG TPA: ester cyclase [Anaerolineales bacterium]|nr:ester cyclase [Anaerolineales bacterium]